MSGIKFSIDPTTDESFYVTVADEITVYAQYEDAVAEVQDKLQTDTDSFIAEVNIAADSEDDVAVALEQVSWQQVITDLP